MAGGEGVVVAQAATEFEARLKCIALCDAGIDATVLRDSRSASLDQAVTGKAGVYVVRVPTDQQEDAERALQDAAASGQRFDADDAAGESDAVDGSPQSLRSTRWIAHIARAVAWIGLALVGLSILAFLVISLLEAIGVMGGGNGP